MIAVLSEEQKASKKIQDIKVLMDTGDSHDGEVEVN